MHRSYDNTKNDWALPWWDSFQRQTLYIWTKLIKSKVIIINLVYARQWRNQKFISEWTRDFDKFANSRVLQMIVMLCCGRDSFAVPATDANVVCLWQFLQHRITFVYSWKANYTVVFIRWISNTDWVHTRTGCLFCAIAEKNDTANCHLIVMSHILKSFILMQF